MNTRPKKEFLFITDKSPRSCGDDRAYLARLIRGYRKNPDQFLLWRENGETRVQVRGTPSVIGAIRSKREA